MTITRLGHIRYRGRIIEPGHPVKVLPSKRGKHDGFDTTIISIPYDSVACKPSIEVKDPKTSNIRVLPLKRVRPYLRNVEKKKQQR